jgi:hypothetical protein
VPRPVTPDVVVTLAAQACRANGWSAGDIVIGGYDRADDVAAFEISAIGKERILVVRLADRRGGRWFACRDKYETTVGTFTREIRLATPDEAAAIRAAVGGTNN